MADKLYPKFKAKLLKKTYDLSDPALVMRAILLDATSDYVYSDAHEFLSDVPAGARVKKTNPLTGKAVNLTTAGFDSDDPTAEAVTGENIGRLILYIEGVTDTASPLVHFRDTGISTVPFTPTGTDIRVVVGANGWFVL